MLCDVVHQAPVIGNYVIETFDPCSYADDRRSFRIRQKIFDEVFGHAFMDQGIVAENDAVIIMYFRQVQYALKPDYVKRIGRGDGTCSEDVNNMPLLSGIVIKILHYGQGKIPIHIPDKNTQSHGDIILTYRQICK